MSRNARSTCTSAGCAELSTSTTRPTSSGPCGAAATRSISTRLKLLVIAGSVLLATAWTAPPPLIPEDNPPSAASVELGRWLFYDKRLSVNGTYACASCHRLDRAFTDGRPVAIGATGKSHWRNTPSLANVVYRPVLAWAEPRLRRLEKQLLIPLLGTRPVEMGASEQVVLAVLREDELYRSLFADAFGGEVSLANAAKAIAAFERTLISFESTWDRGAHSESARRGEALFFSERANCFRCHPAPHFTDTYRTADLPFDEIAFHNIGLSASDRTRYRSPSLRNVAVTAPYMHDGSIATLAEVIDHYAAGGRGAGARNPHKSTYVTGFSISEAEKKDLIAFLESLTDESFLSDPRFADPFAEIR